MQADRRGVHAAAVLRQPAHGGASPEARACGQPQASAAAHARNLTGGDGPGAGHEREASAAQDPSISAARPRGEAAEPDAEHGRNLQPAGARLCLPGGDHRLVQPARPVVAAIEQHGCVVLRGPVSRRRCAHTASRRSSTAIRARNLRAMPSPAYSRGKRLRSVWTGAGGRGATSSSNGCGAASSIKTCT